MVNCKRILLFLKIILYLLENCFSLFDLGDLNSFLIGRNSSSFVHRPTTEVYKFQFPVKFLHKSHRLTLEPVSHQTRAMWLLFGVWWPKAIRRLIFSGR